MFGDREREAWASILSRLREIAAGEIGAAISQASLLSVLSRANDEIRRVQVTTGLLHGWEIRFFSTERDREGNFIDPMQAANITRRLTLIAVDPHGVGHDIEALAR